MQVGVGTKRCILAAMLCSALLIVVSMSDVLPYRVVIERKPVASGMTVEISPPEPVRAVAAAAPEVKKEKPPRPATVLAPVGDLCGAPDRLPEEAFGVVPMDGDEWLPIPATGGWKAAMSTLRQCHKSFVKLHNTSDAAPEDFVVRVVYWVGDTDNAKPCEKFSSECTRMVQRLDVWTGIDGRLQATFTPDSSSAHYVVVVTGPGSCTTSKLHTPAAFDVNHAISACRTPAVPGAGVAVLRVTPPEACQPLLHKGLPSLNDFHVAALGGNDLDALQALGVEPGQRIQTGATMVAKFGVNKFLVTFPKWGLDMYREFVTTATIYGRLSRTKTIVNVEFSFEYDETLGGYVGGFDLREDGTYSLEVYVGWFHGEAQPPSFPRPVLVGGHMRHEFHECNLRRAGVRATPLKVVLSGDTPNGMQVFGNTKCTSGDAPGRWLWMSMDKPCSPPYCTGDRHRTVNAMDWDGSSRRQWVWVPYTCYYHLYTKKDLYRCAEETNITWVHAMGDSQEREFVAHMKMMNGSQAVETTKFEQADWIMYQSPNDLRITWQFYTETLLWQDASVIPRDFNLDKKLFDHYNLAPSSDSGQPLGWCDTAGRSYGLDKHESDRPNVFVANNAAAYTAWFQTFDSHKAWMERFLEYFKHGKALAAQGAGKYKPMRMIWLSPHFVFSQAHDGTEYVTTRRVAEFDAYSRSLMADMGVPVVDATQVTRSRWEAAYDGLHYYSGGNDNWHGVVSTMVSQIVLNTIFPTCGQ